MHANDTNKFSLSPKEFVLFLSLIESTNYSSFSEKSQKSKSVWGINYYITQFYEALITEGQNYRI